MINPILGRSTPIARIQAQPNMQAVRFGAEAEPTPPPAPEEQKAEPKKAKLSFLQKYTAFLSPTNLSAGVKAAKETLDNAGWFEGVMIGLDALLATMSVSLHLLLAPLFPDGMAFSKTLKAFIHGVQNAEVAKLVTDKPKAKNTAMA